MKIKKEEGDTVAEFRKLEIGRCEVCGEKFDSKGLCARHLQYGNEVDDMGFAISSWIEQSVPLRKILFRFTPEEDRIRVCEDVVSSKLFAL